MIFCKYLLQKQDYSSEERSSFATLCCQRLASFWICSKYQYFGFASKNPWQVPSTSSNYSNRWPFINWRIDWKKPPSIGWIRQNSHAVEFFNFVAGLSDISTALFCFVETKRFFDQQFLGTFQLVHRRLKQFACSKFSDYSPHVRHTKVLLNQIYIYSSCACIINRLLLKYICCFKIVHHIPMGHTDRRHV